MEDDKKQKELIDNIRNEGHLTRSADEDSLRSVKTGFDKFADVFSSMKNAVIEQGSILLGLCETQEKILKINEDTLERQRIKDELEKVTRTEVNPRETESNTSGESGGDRITPSPGFMERLIAGIGPGIGGFIGAAIGGITGMLGSSRAAMGILFRSVPLIALAPYIGDFVSTIVETGLRDYGSSEEFISSVSDPVTRAAIGGSLGLIFGRRGAMVGIMAGLVSSYASNVLNALGLDDETVTDETWSLLGLDFSTLGATKTILGVLGGSLVLLAPTLLRLATRMLATVLSGPVGLAALVGGSLVGIAGIIDNWLEERRSAFIEELEERTAAGFASLDRVATAPDIPFGRRIGLAFGAEPETAMEELRSINSTANAATQFVSGNLELGEPVVAAVPDGTQRDGLIQSVTNILGDDPNTAIRNISDDAIDLLENLGNSLRLPDILELVNAERNRRELQSTIESIRQDIEGNRNTRNNYISEFPDFENSTYLMRLDNHIEQLEIQLSNLTARLSRVDNPFGSFNAELLEGDLNPSSIMVSPSIMGRVNPLSVLERIEEDAAGNTGAPSVVIANAPTVAPINNNVRGGTTYNNQRFNSGNTGSSFGLGRFAN